MPIVRYTLLVGSLLLGILFLLGDRDTPAGAAAPDRWTSMDSLRAMAHLGEAVQSVSPVRMERAPPEPANRNGLIEIAIRENPLIVSAQANMDVRKTAGESAVVKPRKRKIPNRQVRVRTTIAENTPRMPSDAFPPNRGP